MGNELYKLNDRTGSELILAPTYEEEITKLVGKEVHSWRGLPVKVYQTSKKFRDEPRPRNGLLRTREFLMKDLYTFDADMQGAQQSYKQVQTAYDAIMTRLFGEQTKGWRIAEADTGAMGGSQSHEYQVQDDVGEDTLITCSNCSYTANEELAASVAASPQDIPIASEDVQVVLYGSDDVASHGCTLSAIVIAKDRSLNEAKIARHLAEDSKKPLARHSKWDWEDRPEGPIMRFDKLQVLLDQECKAVEAEEISLAILQAIEAMAMPGQGGIQSSLSLPDAPTLQDYFQSDSAISTTIVDLHKAEAGDRCSSCHQGTLQKTKSIEVGHTFLLGNRYSKSLEYDFAQKEGKKEPFQMGCYGIGITRILGVLAQVASRQMQEVQKVSSIIRPGFAWNRNVAPFTALILPLEWDDAKKQAASVICQALQSDNSKWGLCQSKDIAIDDRHQHVSFGAKLSQADLVGYPLVFLLGKHFDRTGEVEVRRRTSDSIEQTTIPLSDFQKSE
jgi:prolyl-tRNA synthetase